jgi:uncharacterized protein
MKSRNSLRKFLFAIFVGYVSALPMQASALECLMHPKKTKIEQLICADQSAAGLYALDDALNTFYSQALLQAENKQEVVNAQKKWLKEVRNACDDGECLKKVYQNRVSALQQSSTLCKSTEDVVYSCTLQSKKIVSFCASKDAGPTTGFMQYRTGRSQSNLEMSFPKELSPAKNHFKFVARRLGGAPAVSFWSDGKRYSVFHTYATHEAGLIVSRGQPPVRDSYTKCLGQPAEFQFSSLPFFNLDERLGLPAADDYGNNALDYEPSGG